MLFRPLFPVIRSMLLVFAVMCLLPSIFFVVFMLLGFRGYHRPAWSLRQPSGSPASTPWSGFTSVWSFFAPLGGHLSDVYQFQRNVRYRDARLRSNLRLRVPSRLYLNARR